MHLHPNNHQSATKTRPAALRGIFFLSLIFSLLLTACGAKKVDSPYLGVWTIKEYTVLGVTTSVEELGVSRLDFKDTGKVELTFLKESMTADWEETKDGVFIKSGSTKIEAKSFAGNLQLTYNGVDMVFARGEAVAAAPQPTQEQPAKPEPTEPPAATTEPAAESGDLTPTQKQWNGFWFGSLWVPETYGSAWEGSAGYLDDYYVYLEVDAEGFGFMDGRTTPFDPSNPYDSDFSMWIQADEYHYEQVRDEAWFWDMDIIEGENGKDFWFGPTPDNKDAVVMAGRYIDPEEEGDQGVDFIITIFRWGSEWDDDISRNPPPGYAEYREAVELGLTPVDLAKMDEAGDAADDGEEAAPADSSPSAPATTFPNKLITEFAVVPYPANGVEEETMFGDLRIAFSDQGYEMVAREGLDDYDAVMANYERSKESYPDMVTEKLTIDGHDATVFRYVSDIGPSIDVIIRLNEEQTFVVQFNTQDYSGGMDRLDGIPEINQIINQIDILD